MKDRMQSETLCTAHRKSGQPCKNYALRGSNVCRMHGGAAPQVRKAAAVRILMAADKAAARLVELMQDKNVPYAVQLAAASDLLDRAQLAAKNESVVTVEIAEWEQRLMKAVKPVKVEMEYIALPPGYDENGFKIGSGEAEHAAAKAAAEVALWRAGQGGPVAAIEAAPVDPEAAAKAAAKAERNRKAKAQEDFNKKRGEFLEKRMAEPVVETNSYPLTPIRAKKRT